MNNDRNFGLGHYADEREKVQAPPHAITFLLGVITGGFVVAVVALLVRAL